MREKHKASSTSSKVTRIFQVTDYKNIFPFISDLLIFSFVCKEEVSEKKLKHFFILFSSIHTTSKVCDLRKAGLSEKCMINAIKIYKYIFVSSTGPVIQNVI